MNPRFLFAILKNMKKILFERKRIRRRRRISAVVLMAAVLCGCLVPLSARAANTGLTEEQVQEAARAAEQEQIEQLVREQEQQTRYEAYLSRFNAVQTVDDITAQGERIIEKHIFEIPLTTDEESETVWFYTAIDTECRRAAVFLADADGEILYKTSNLECNYAIIGSADQGITDMISVDFRDVNDDGLTDILLIAGYDETAGAGTTRVGEVLFQQEGSTFEALSFYRDWRINDKINRYGMNSNTKCILEFVRDGRSTEFLYTAATEDELTDGGFEVIREQSYWRTYEKLGKLKVLPGIFRISDFDIFMIYMINEDGNIVWRFETMEDYDNLYSLRGMSARDVDNDGMKDLVVLARYSLEGENGETVIATKCDIFYQRMGGFEEDTEFTKGYTVSADETMEQLTAKIREFWDTRE